MLNPVYDEFASDFDAPGSSEETPTTTGEADHLAEESEEEEDDTDVKLESVNAPTAANIHETKPDSNFEAKGHNKKIIGQPKEIYRNGTRQS